MKKYLLSLITLSLLLCEASFTGGTAFAETFDYTYSSKEYTCTILTDTESSKTVSIAAKSGATFSGSVSIPSSAKNTATNKTYSVTAIAKQGFKDKSSITSISIPSSVKSIGYQAFYGTNISSITIPENVEIAGDEMVNSCSNLTSITWNAKNCTKCNNSIGNAVDIAQSTNPFYNTPRSNVTSFTFGNKVETIPAYICYSFSKIEKITLPASVTTIGNYAFQNCTGLVEFYVAPKSPVTMYSSYMLSGCTKLEKINISKAVTSLGERAFYNCSALQYIFAQASSAPSVGTNALYNVPTSATKLQMLNSDSYNSYNSTSPWNTFTNRNWISSYTITYDSKHTLTMLSHDDDNDTLYVSTQVKSGVTLSSGSVTLPPEYTSSGGLYYGYRVKPTTIVDNAYKNQTSITGVTIGDSYSSIGASAFQGCSSLATVSVGKNITSVGSSAFASTAITSVTWNALNCPDFGSYSASPFYGRRTSITSFTISTSIKHIPAYLCYGMNALTGTSSTSRTFYGSLKSIGTYAFYGCSSMTSISFSNASSLKTIGASAFQSCSNVTSSISIPASVESIGASAFSGCSKLAGLTFNKKASLKTIGGSAFSGCSKISGALFIPDSVISLGTNTFYNCTTLVSVEFGKGTQIELLDKWVFQNCSGLKYVVIPATVDSISELALDGCTGLEYIVSKPTTPPGVVNTSSHTFKNVSRTIPIYVANTTAANKYKVARGWSEFYAANENAFATYMGGSGEEYKCGDNLYWQLNLADGTLSFTGSGDMYNYDNSSNKAPWRAYDYFLGSLSLNNSSMTSIGNYAFYSCTGLLGSLSINSSITTIGKYAFDYCEGFTSLTMSPASIGIWAFGYCKGLKSVTINDGLTILPKEVFDGCYALETVKLPSTLEKIRDDAFYNCSTIVAMHIPASVDSIGTRAFSGCRGLQYIKSDNPTPPLAVSASFTSVPKTIPICVPSAEAIEDYKVATGWKDYFTDLSVFGQVITGTCNESINWRIDFSDGTLTVYGSGDMPNYTSNTMPWYEYNQDVRQIVVEEGITTIGKFAFYGMPEVVSISLPEGLTTVSASAFSSNTGRDITELTLPSTLTSIGEYAFSGLSHLTKINVLSSSSTPATMTVSKTGYSDYDYLNFASSAFNNAVLVLPNVSNPVVYSTASGWRKFLHHGGYCGAGEGGTNQTWDYNTSTNVLTISGTGNMADYNYTGDNVSPWYAYRSLYTSVRVENGVQHLGAYAFRDCSELSIVHLPASINAMSGNVFSICNSLTDYTYAGTLAQWFNINFATLTGSPIYITHKFYLNGEYPASLTIPNTFTTIPENAFYGCTSLTSVVLSEGIERIEDQAFQGCSEMVSITLPRSLRFVGTRGLYSMTKLENINYNGTSGDWCRIAFEAGTSHPLYNNEKATLYCDGELPTEVIVPNDVNAIGQYQFYKVSSITSVTISPNVSSIGTHAFYNSGITSVVWNAREFDDFENASSAPFNNRKTYITSFTFGNDVEYIPAYLCNGMNNAAFTSITIPASVTSIGENAFDGCTNIATVTSNAASVPSIASSTFPTAVESAATLYVPANVTSRNAYTSDTYWREFDHILPYVITFDLQDHGDDIDPICVNAGRVDDAQKPTAPTETGYTFGGWYQEEGCTTPFTFGESGTVVNSDMTLYAKWTASNYAITYKDHGNVAYSGSNSASLPATHTYDSETALVDGVKTGYTFGGWFANSDCTGDAITSLGATDYTDAITLYAKWTINQYTVSFDSNGGSEVSSITQNYGTEVSAPANPSREGYTFNGWLPAVPSTMPASNTECVAQWTINQYTISFDSNGGSAVAPITQDYNSAVTTPADPTKTGYTFAGWSPAVPSTMPAEDTECLAQWTINSYNITFDLQGHGSAIDAQSVEYNGTASQPDAPEAANYTFGGWFDNTDCTGSAYNFSTPITNDLILYAKWTLNDLVLDEEEDNSALITAYDTKTTDVTIARSLTNAQYNTFCLPFSLNASQMATAFGADYDLEELTAVTYDGEVLGLVFTQREALVAGKPYLLQPENSVSNPSFENVTISSAAPSDGLGNTFIEFHGVYSPTSLTGGNKNLLFLGAGNELFWPNATGDLKGFRAYFEVKGAAKAAKRARIVKKEDTATGIETITNDQSPITNKIIKDNQLFILRDGKTYNAQGMRVE